MLDLNRYDNFVFDCDGVLLDSNSVKTEAFLKVLESRVPLSKVEESIAHHRANGGISRFEKLDMYLDGEGVEEALQEFGSLVTEALLNVDEVPGAYRFLSSIPREKKVFVLTGGKQSEVTNALVGRGLSLRIDAILGSPNTKRDNADAIIASGRTIMFGDSKLDYELAQSRGWDFVFLWGVTDFDEWPTYFGDKNIVIARDFRSLV